MSNYLLSLQIKCLKNANSNPYHASLISIKQVKINWINLYRRSIDVFFLLWLKYKRMVNNR